VPGGCSRPGTSPLTQPRAAPLANDRRGPYAITFTPAARRRPGAVPLPAAAALDEHRQLRAY
jgi:hypothetical protein